MQPQADRKYGFRPMFANAKPKAGLVNAAEGSHDIRTACGRCFRIPRKGE